MMTTVRIALVTGDHIDLLPPNDSAAPSLLDTVHSAMMQGGFMKLAGRAGEPPTLVNTAHVVRVYIRP